MTGGGLVYLGSGSNLVLTLSYSDFTTWFFPHNFCSKPQTKTVHNLFYQKRHDRNTKFLIFRNQKAINDFVFCGNIEIWILMFI